MPTFHLPKPAEGKVRSRGGWVSICSTASPPNEDYGNDDGDDVPGDGDEDQGDDYGDAGACAMVEHSEDQSTNETKQKY